MSITGVDIAQTIAALFYVGGLFVGSASFTWMLYYKVKVWWFFCLCLMLFLLIMVTAISGVKLLTGFFAGAAFTSLVFTPMKLIDKGYNVEG